MGIIRLIFEIVEGFLRAIIGGFVDCLKSLFTPDRKTELNADFLPAGEVLSSWNKGFCFGKKSLTIQDSFKNALVTGSTGNFKSSGILTPSLLKMRGHSSLFVTDFSGELQLKTSGAFLAADYEVSVINWGAPAASAGYNPLKHLTNNTSDIQKLSKMLVVTVLGTASKDPFWNLASESLISLTTKFIVLHTPEEYHTLYNVYHLVSAIGYAPDKVDYLFLRANDPELWAEYKSFASYGNKVISSIIATCRAALSIFGTDPNVALTTSHDTIDIASFKKQKKILYLTTNTKDMRYYSVITSIFLEQCFGEIMGHLPGKDELPVFFLIDEASSLYFNNLQIVVSNIRKYNSGILQIYQSPAQLVDLYGQSVAKAITENSYAHVIMGGQHISVAQELESTLGKFEYLDDKEVRHVRSLMTADEIRQMDDALILCGNKPAIKMPIVPYFRQPRLNRLTKLPPYEPINKLPFTKPPRLPLD